MITFAYPYLFVLLIVPLMVALLPWSIKTHKPSLLFPSFGVLKNIKEHHGIQNGVQRSSWLERLVSYLAFALVVVALARPVELLDPIVKEESLRDVLIAIDLSASMEAKDFELENGSYVNRLDAQKKVLNDFFDLLPHENFALIFYGSGAFVQSPFSSDTNSTKHLLNEAQIGMAGPKTVIGDAIGLGVKLFEDSNVSERLMILMSDGSDSGSKVPPLKAAKLAKEHGVRIISIAVGDVDATGEEKVDISTLQEIASITGGEFYFASDTKSLLDVYAQINKLHPKKVKKLSYRPTRDLFIYPLLAALLVLLLFTLFNTFKKRGEDV